MNEINDLKQQKIELNQVIYLFGEYIQRCNTLEVEHNKLNNENEKMQSEKQKDQQDIEFYK